MQPLANTISTIKQNANICFEKLKIFNPTFDTILLKEKPIGAPWGARART